jgi:hypothetical protein
MEIDKIMFRMEHELDMTQDEILDFCRQACLTQVFIEFNKHLRVGLVELKSELDILLDETIRMVSGRIQNDN